MRLVGRPRIPGDGPRGVRLIRAESIAAGSIIASHHHKSLLPR